ncbi:putative toxin-antitoxin system toxin component, PIN family [Bacillus pacificus]|uniref:putative toxin-antitoxin system toxin component, PIN family n=1 Tax=Bacillus cereus group TaxID=86661 RepID=UPI0013D4DAB5|nr:MULTISPECIES: putative toxin-antitoxin system toxin component, PIN family [Bacillus cereus group]MCC2482682.1 putative toxin-antitoxin system toxin component, PIN family [Bacillus pacificus]MDK7447166.1 putative toxin-antitoxin system toxin component, PIN family [Bacillus paranthracis]MDN8630400.1 putative toxin-antitoxin system toxin component, PIN family [Bacillus paranthracis]MDN8638495.1 putative toxin-antitoxin system toxin component, PIN family [Bacillus paranthracis]HDR7852007.1 puta
MGNKKKVVIDTNIFIDGWFRDSVSGKEIIDLIDNRKFYLAFSQETIGELLNIVKNFARKHLEDRKEQLKLIEYVATLYYYASSVNTKDTVVDPINDKYDEMFLKCAKEAKVDFLVSNDLNSGMHEQASKYGFKIVNASDFVKFFK